MLTHTGSALRTTVVPSPIGPLTLVGRDGTLVGLHLADQRHAPRDQEGWERDDDAFGDVRAQLAGYFAGTRTDFDLPLALEGTPFQRRVWDALRQIPYGETWSYRELAERVGVDRGYRAVGLANGRNPVAVIVPCHRVIAADGTLGGYGGGLDRKRWLLDHETSHRPS